MKKLYIIITLLILGGIYSCKSLVHLNVSEPPAVFLEKEYVSAGVINRTFSEGGAKIIDVVENALTLEGQLDYVGSTAAAQGLFDELTVNPAFEYVRLLDSLTVKNGGMDVFPAQLSWEEVENICQREGVQLLFVLEVYDTDTKIDYSTKKEIQNTPLGDISLLRHTARLTTIVKTGWRIYDPKNKIIRDQYFFNDRSLAVGSGISPAKALSTLLQREQYVKQLSSDIGHWYAGRLIGQVFRVSRDYFTKGSSNLKIARRRSQVGDWDGAAELWLKDTESHKRKVAGRACYNMAISEEINGDVYKAYEWAQKSYTDYKIKEGLHYSKILRNRIRRLEKSKALNENETIND